MCCSRLLKMPAPIAVLCVHKELHCCLMIVKPVLLHVFSVETENKTE